MTSIKSLGVGLALTIGFVQGTFAYKLENYGVKAYESTIKGSCTFDFIKQDTPLSVKQELSELNTHQQRIMALALRILNGHIKVKHDSYDDRWGVYCNIGTNYSVPLVVFDPFWTWDPSINTELLNITLEVLNEHPELTPHIETLWGDVLPVSTGQYSERASDVWDWIYRNISVNVKS